MFGGWGLGQGCCHTLGRPADDVHSLGVLGQRCEILDFSVLAVGFHLPELGLVSGSSAQATVGRWCILGWARRTRTFVSPPAVARRPLPEGSKWAE